MPEVAEVFFTVSKSSSTSRLMEEVGSAARDAAASGVAEGATADAALDDEVTAERKLRVA